MDEHEETDEYIDAIKGDLDSGQRSEKLARTASTISSITGTVYTVKSVQHYIVCLRMF